MAFGGVETGKNNAQEADNPTIRGRITGSDADNIPAAGTNTATVAVLLITFDKMTVAYAKITANASREILKSAI